MPGSPKPERVKTIREKRRKLVGNGQQPIANQDGLRVAINRQASRSFKDVPLSFEVGQADQGEPGLLGRKRNPRRG
jgi:hypothetical protein